MAEPCRHRSRSSCSCQRSQIPINYSQRNFSNATELRCTCPHPPSLSYQSHGRANILLSRPVSHLSQSASVQPKIRDIPIITKPGYSQSTHHYSQYFPAQNFHRFRYGHFGQPAGRYSRCCPSGATSFISQPCFSPPQFHYAQVCHPSYTIRDDEHRVQQICYLRVYPKYTSELFVAEYSSLERVFAHPVLLASWVLPSSHPYFSVVLLRAPLRDAICCDPFSNVCVTTIGGKQRRKHRQGSFDPQSLYDIMGPSKEERCSSPSCPTCNDDDRSECLSCATSRLLLNADSIRISEADPEACCCASFSEPLTLENDVYESDSKEESEMPRRKPYTTEASSSTSRGNLPDSATQRSRRSYSQSIITKGTTGGRSETVTAEREALSILQSLESFFGLKNTSIGSSRPADSRAGTDCCSCCYTTKCSSCHNQNDSESTGSTARLICYCPECRGADVTQDLFRSAKYRVGSQSTGSTAELICYCPECRGSKNVQDPSSPETPSKNEPSNNESTGSTTQSTCHCRKCSGSKNIQNLPSPKIPSTSESTGSTTQITCNCPKCKGSKTVQNLPSPKVPSNSESTGSTAELTCHCPKCSGSKNVRKPRNFAFSSRKESSGSSANNLLSSPKAPAKSESTGSATQTTTCHCPKCSGSKDVKNPIRGKVPTDSESTGSTAQITCHCRECSPPRRAQDRPRTDKSSDSRSRSTSLVRTSVIAKSWSSTNQGDKDVIRYTTNPSDSMVSVPSFHGATANELLLESPCKKSDDAYVTAPNAMSNTISLVREDSRSGGRDYRRPTIRQICGRFAYHDLSDATMTAQPIYDPKCQQCSESRFADRLCETLDEDCSCVPIIRTSPGGSISLISDSTAKPIAETDTVMDDKNKDKLSNYIEKSEKKGRTTREAVMRWVRRKSAQCRNRMRSNRQTSGL
ncbi:hypothetical protein V3C99_006810 [Haemonchus contortus]